MRFIFLRDVRRQLRRNVAHRGALAGDQFALQFLNSIRGFIVQACGGNALNQWRGGNFPLTRTLINSRKVFLSKIGNLGNTGQIQWNTTHHGAGAFACARRRKSIHFGLLRFICLRIAHGAKHGALHVSNGVVGTCDRAAPRNFAWIFLAHFNRFFNCLVRAKSRVMFGLRGANGLVAQQLPLIHIRVERLLAFHALRIRWGRVLHPIFQVLGLQWLWNFGRAE